MESYSPVSYDLTFISIDSVIPNEWTLEERLTDTSIKEMADSMVCLGLLQPIRVAIRGSNYKLVFGARRFAAARRLGWATIPAFVCDWDDAHAFAAALAENVQDKSLSFLQTALAIDAGILNRRLLRSSLPEVLGKSRDFVDQVLQIVDFPLDIQLMLHAAPWTIWCAWKINMIIDAKQRETFIYNAISHLLTAKQIEDELQRPSGFVNETLCPAIAPSNPEVPDQSFQDGFEISIQAIADGVLSSNHQFNEEIHPSHLTRHIVELIASVPSYNVPLSLDEQCDLIALICDAITHLLYVFLLTRPTIRSSKMIQSAIDRAPHLPLEWLS